MFRWFKKKKKEKAVNEAYVRYKIVPYQDLGFHVERHTGNSTIEVYKLHIDHFDKVKLTPFNGDFLRYFSPYDQWYTSPVVFNTKEEARKLVDAFISKENNYKAQAEDARRSIERFTLENPPEWYP